MNKRVLIIGGSPCSGKSTVAERISKEYDAYYFKVDDYLDEFIKIAAQKGRPACKKSVTMTPDEIWMREPIVQCEEEFLIYDEISELIFEYLEQINADIIITEGAAYTPRVMKHDNNSKYIAIIPTADFQVTHYKEREWVPHILEGCSNKQQAFNNWMERDILFAQKVAVECGQNGVPCIVNDGTKAEEEMFLTVKKLFQL